MTDASLTVRQAIGRWLDYRSKMAEFRLVALSTLANQSQIAETLGEAFATVPLDRLRKSHIELWMGRRLQTHAPITVRGEMNVLRQVLRWCIDEGLLVQPPRMPTLSVPSTEEALPSDEAFLWVLANVPPQHAAALEFMMLTGLSPHELERVQVQDARPVRHLYQNESVDLGIGQRPDFAVKQPSRRRWVPLNGRARVLWFEAAAGTGSQDYAPFPKVDAMQKAIRRAVDGSLGSPGRCNGADIAPIGARDITPKLMRKWFASKVSSAQPEHVLQRLMGHAPGSPITRRHYVRSTDAQGVEAVEALTP